jgi:hypothetical protein
MNREVCGICWCPYDDNGACGCKPQTGVSMNREDIIRMAREAGSIDRKDGKNVVLYAAKTGGFVDQSELLRFAALVAAAEREAIMDEWSACVQSDLENGVRWLNEQAAKKWQESYPAMAGFRRIRFTRKRRDEMTRDDIPRSNT